MGKEWTILVVEDDRGLNREIERILSKEGFIAKAVYRGEEALDYCKGREDVILLMDFFLPDMRGDDLIQQFKQDGRIPPFIVMSGRGDVQTAVDMMKRGGLDYIIKADRWIGLIPHILRQALFILEQRQEQRNSNEETDHINRMLYAIHSLNRLIIQESNPERLVEKACQMLVDSGGYRNAWIALFDDSGKINLLKHAGLEETFKCFAKALKSGKIEGCLNAAMEEPEGVVITVGSAICGNCPLIQFNTGFSTMTRRIEHGGEIFGAISVTLPNQFIEYREEQSLFSAIAGDLGFALQKYKIEIQKEFSERELIDTLESMSDAFISLDVNLNIRYFNEAAEKILHKTAADVAGYNLLEKIPAFNSPLFIDNVKRCLQKKQTVIFEQFIDHPPILDWFEFRLHPGPDGLWAYIIVTTERKEQQKRLEASEKKFRNIIGGSPDAIFITDRKGNYIYVNQNAVNMLGYSEKELLAMNIVDLSTGDEIKKNLEFFQSIHQDGPLFLELTLVRKDGSTFPVDLNAILLADGGVYGSCRDISERIQSRLSLEKALESEKRRKTELESLLEGARTVLEEAPFKISSRKIFDMACRITGARSGYVALLSEDGAENELLFLESGGLSCTVDPELPMPVRGLREEAYRSGRAVYDNDFMKTLWVHYLPEGHVRLDNVLFAPLNIEERTVGVIGLANKPSGFTENDLRMAEAFGQLAAIALKNSQVLEALEKSRKRLVSAQRIAKTGDFTWNVETGRITWSEGLYNLLGYDQEERIDLEKVNSRIHHPDDAAMVMRWLEQSIESGSNELTPREYRLVRKDSKTIHVRAIGIIRRLEKGQHEIFATIQDITDRKLAQQALEESEHRLQMLLDNIIDVVWQMDLRLNFTYVSPSIEVLTGYTPEEWVGTNLARHASRKEFIKMARKALGAVKNYRTFNHLTFEAVMYKKDGEEIPVEITGKLLLNAQGRPMAIQGTTRDIRERKHAAMEIKKNLREKEILLRELYHRTKNNMQVVSSLLRLRARSISNEEIRSAFHEIENKIISMALVHQKLYESQDLSTLNLKTYFQDLITLIRQSHADSHHVRFHYKAVDVPALIDTAVPLGLVLNELLTNALKHAFPEGRRGVIRIRIDFGPRKGLIITYADNGVGLPEGFDPEKNGKLGMITIYDLITHQLGGEIHFCNENGLKCIVKIREQIYGKRV